jgi:hypothetical protein
LSHQQTKQSYTIAANKKAVADLRKMLCDCLAQRWNREHVPLIPYADLCWCPFIVLSWLAEVLHMNILVIVGDIGDNITPYQSFIVDINYPYIIFDWEVNHVQPLFQCDCSVIDDTGTGSKKGPFKLDGKKFQWTHLELQEFFIGEDFFNIDASHPRHVLDYLSETVLGFSTETRVACSAETIVAGNWFCNRCTFAFNMVSNVVIFDIQ